MKNQAQRHKGTKAQSKKHFSLCAFVPLCLWACIIAFFLPRPGYSQQIRWGVDYLFERVRQADERPQNRFTQIYDVTLEKSVRPLYDLKFKFQIKSEQEQESEDRNREDRNSNQAQSLPSLTFHLGNQVVGLDSGFSQDSIREKDLNYDLSRRYSTFIWKPFSLPKVTVQYQREERDLDAKEDSADERKLVMRDDYQLAFGIFAFSHSYALEKKDVLRGDSLYVQQFDNYDLHNKGQVNYQFSALDSRLQLNSDYELSHHDKEDEETNNIYRSLEQRANLRFHGLPSQNTAVHYNLSLGETQKWSEHNRQRNIENNLKTELLPYEHLKTTLELSHNNRWETGAEDVADSKFVPFSARTLRAPRTSVVTYGLRLEPKIPGLIMDPNLPMPPLKTSLLLSSSLNREDGQPQYQTNSALLKGATEVYPGVELRTDLEVNHTRNRTNLDEKWAENFKIDTSFDLRDDLKYYFRNENDWGKFYQEGSFDAIRTFRGNTWQLVTYRPADQLFLTIDNKLEYGDIDNVIYSYRIGWVPAPKIRLEARYQSAEASEDKYFSSEMNVNITKTLKFRIKYTYPSDDQVISFRFTLKT